jgi:hypothetical protein
MHKRVRWCGGIVERMNKRERRIMAGMTLHI